MSKNINLFKKFILVGSIMSLTMLYCSDVGFYYKHQSLVDFDTGESAKGINTMGVEGNIFNIFYFDYAKPQGTEQKNLQKYADRTTEMEEYGEKIKVGIKPLFFFDSLKNIYLEYNKDVYQSEYDTFSKYYLQELLFFRL